MSGKSGESADDSMLELFRAEVEHQAAMLLDGLPALSRDGQPQEALEPLVRAAHSIKGAGRLMDIGPVAKLAQPVEEYLNGVRSGRFAVSRQGVALLVESVNMLLSLAEATKQADKAMPPERQGAHERLLAEWRAVLNASPEPPKPPVFAPPARQAPTVPQEDGPAAAPAPEPACPPLAQTEDAVLTAPTVSLSFSSDASMLELFRLEVEQHGQVITEGLLKLEESPASPDAGESLMRAAHSIKGAARLVGLQEAVKLAHLMEDYLVAMREGRLRATPEGIDVLLKSNDMLATLATLTAHAGAVLDSGQYGLYAKLTTALDKVLAGGTPSAFSEEPVAAAPPAPVARIADEGDEAPPTPRPAVDKRGAKPAEHAGAAATDRVLRISSEQLNRLMGLAGESMVEARWLRPYAESMLQLKRRQAEIISLLDALREALDDGGDRERMKRQLRETQVKASECRHILAGRLADLESYDRRVVNLSSRLRREVVTSRMRPFGDGVKGFARLVRDLARQLGKQAQLHIDGHATMVDRDILDKIEAPLNHLLRNAIDHGIEFPDERVKAGKPESGTIRLAAYHHAGMLSIVMEDDGRGVDLERLRRKVVERRLVTSEMAENLGSAELMEFLFLPNFSTRDQVTDLSGRGVGLDVVHDVVQEMRGLVRATSQFGAGTRFQLQLPLTLSVLPALLVEIAGEAYAFPLARIERIMHVGGGELREIEGHQYISVGDHHIGLVSAHQLLGFTENPDSRPSLPVVVLGDRKKSYGLVIDRFLGERDLVVHVLPPRLGKVKDISSAALMEDGTPLLIFDVDDIFRSLEKIIGAGRLSRVRGGEQDKLERSGKRILVVDDSITVREVERKLLEASGYEVEIAVDGMDGWNALREGTYDLVITDIDMPRMDGIELVKLIRNDAKYQKLPVMIVSYKDREEDRYRGLEAGADYYLTKGSFHDETLREAVVDLIGTAA